MPTGGVRIEGLTQVVRDLQSLGLDVDDLKEAFSSIAREGAETAAGFAPKRTGRLSGSIRGNRAKSKAVVTAGRASIPYAGPINYGWPGHKISASNFFARTDAVMEPKALELLDREINNRIRLRGL